MPSVHFVYVLVTTPMEFHQQTSVAESYVTEITLTASLDIMFPYVYSGLVALLS